MGTLENSSAAGFADGQWESIVSVVSSSFGFSADESKKLSENKTAKLIAAIPFLAGCSQPMRTAVANLAVYHIARAEGKSVFEHNALDDQDAYARLFSISNFQGGDEKIIKRGMALLALQSLRNHVKDSGTDGAKGKYNPVSEGKWDASAIETQLLTEIQNVESPEMDEILSSGDVDGFWDNN